MFIDYVTLLLINTSAGFFLLALYLVVGLPDKHPKRWVAPFAMVGTISFVNGLIMIHRWPLPGPYNMAYGELSLLFGILFLGASLSLAKGWDLFWVAFYGLFAGASSLVIGLRIFDLGLTREPILSGIGFILSGLSGMFAAPVLVFRSNRKFLLAAAAVLTATSLLWARTGYKAYWSHMEGLAVWVPATPQGAGGQ